MGRPADFPHLWISVHHGPHPVIFFMPVTHTGFPGGSVGKESACNVGGVGSVPGLGKSPGGGHGSPLQYSCLENPHGQRSPAG